MKQFIFSILSLILFLPLGNTQNSQEDYFLTRIQERVNPHIMQQILLHLDKDGLPLSDTRSDNALQLDSTLTFFNYDPTAELDSTPLLRSVYTYPNESLEVLWESWYDGLEWQPLQYTNMVSDNQDRLVEALAMIYDTDLGNYRPESRIEAFPHGNSPTLIDSFFLWEWDVTTDYWTLLLEHHFEYDANDRLISEWTNFNLFGENVYFKDVHSYDAQNNNVLTDHFSEIDGFEFQAGRTVSEYTNNLPVQRTSEVFDGMDFIQERRITYAYDFQDMLVQENEYLWDSEKGAWKPRLEQLFTYDAQQRLATKEISEDQDGYYYFELLTFNYIQDENLAMETKFLRPDVSTPWALDTRTYYFYEGVSSIPNSPMEAHPLNVWPNPTTGSFSVSLEQEAEVHLYNALGQRVGGKKGTGIITMDLNTFPDGVYHLSALQGKQLFRSTLIKE